MGAANTTVYATPPQRKDSGSSHRVTLSLDTRLHSEFGQPSHILISTLIQSFAIPESGIGMLALVKTTKRDLEVLKTIAPQITIPAWSDRIANIAEPLANALGTDASRDLSALRNLPRQAIRDYLTPFGQGLPLTTLRMLHAIRGLLSLFILATNRRLTTDLARELARWLAGNFPSGLEQVAMTPHAIAQLASSATLSNDAIRLLHTIAAALQSEFLDPFCQPSDTSDWVVAPSIPDHEQDDNDDEQTIDKPDNELDLLAPRLAELSIATQRMFAGVVTSRELHSFELELMFPKILGLASGDLSDEAFAAETTFHIGIMPSKYHLLSIHNKSRGFAICSQGNAVHLDLNRLIGHPANEENANNRRTVTIPLPEEFARRFRARLARHPTASRYDQLFAVPMPTLQKSTRSMLRSISVSSHRLTLTRLSRSRGRYALHLCRDEAYSSLIGVDLLLGTTANLNYLTVRATRLKSILRDLYRGIGYSGGLATECIDDTPSLHLPDMQQVSALVSQLTTETTTLITSLPKHCKIEHLFAVHSLVSCNIYTLTKFLSASRPVECETVTRSQLDLIEGMAGITDKRVSPYHELRSIALPAYLATWLNTYIGWLRLVAYRLSNIDPMLAALIHSATMPGNPTDRHPLFFTISPENGSQPIGSQVLARMLARHGIVPNGGRHWVDAVAHDANIDSAAIMGQVGRGNPGQELFGRWSSATPAIALRAVSQSIDQCLAHIDLPPAPLITPRNYHGPVAPGDANPYLPKLLETDTGWMGKALPQSIGAPEPCPFSRSTIANAASFSTLVGHWRSNTPPSGWFGVALALIFEDGVVHASELLGSLAEISTGRIYVSDGRVFVDSNIKALGIRRTDLCPTTLQLARKVPECEAVPRTLTNLESWIGPGGRCLSIHDILLQAEAYVVLHFPGAVSAWARGMTYARTTRPATVARETYAQIEPPTFDLRRRVRCSSGPGSAAQALELAKAKHQEGTSHETALSILRNALGELRANGCDTLHAQIEIGHLHELATTLSNLNTLLRYESGARNFIRLAAEAIEHAGGNEIDWKQIVDTALLDRQSGSAPDITAINSVLRWLGVDLHIYQRTMAPPSALSYAEIVSIREVNVAIQLLDCQQCCLGDDYHLAAIALRLLAKHALRWDSLAHLRLCDLALDNASPHLVISEEAGADLKSDNAIRVIRLTDVETVQDLRHLAELRQARFPHDIYVPVFGDANDSRTIETATRVHRLITDALWRATGSPVICVHDLRHRAITDRIHSVLTPGAHRKFDTLALRQGLIECAVDAGHSWPQVSVENYGHDMESLRTQHYRELLARLTPASDTFVSAVTGIPAATLRKRRSRDPAEIPNLAEGFAWDDFRHQATIIPLASLVASGQDHIPLTVEDRNHQTHTSHAVYIGLRLLGDTPEIARAVSGLTIDQGQRFELSLVSAPQRLGFQLQARSDINRQTFLDVVLDSGLAVAMSVVHPAPSSIARIERSMQRAGDEWIFASPQDALDLAPWVPIWAANDIATEFLMRPSSRSAVDSEILGAARRNGFARARTLPARHFRRGVNAALRFYSGPDSATGSKRIHASAQTAFSVGVCALAILIYPPGEDNVQDVKIT